MSRGLFLTCIVACAAALASCPSTAPVTRKATPVAEKNSVAIEPEALNAPLSIWADPALQGGLDAVQEQFGASGWNVEYKEMAALGELPASGAPDMILGAEPTIKKLLAHELIDESTARTFAGDLLVVATPASKPIVVVRIGDLPTIKFSAFGMGNPETSVGFYGEQALISDGVLDDLEAVTKRYSSSAELLGALKDGTVQLGLIFGSTAAQQTDLRISLTVPEDLHQDIRYQAVATQASADRPEVIAALKLLSEDAEVQKLLGSYGYLDRDTAIVDNR